MITTRHLWIIVHLWRISCRNSSNVLLGICQDGDLLIGAPGPYNWRGAVFKNRIQYSLDEPLKWYQSPVEDPLPTATDTPEPATNYYSYLGCFITTSNHSNNNKHICIAP